MFTLNNPQSYDPSKLPGGRQGGSSGKMSKASGPKFLDLRFADRPNDLRVYVLVPHTLLSGSVQWFKKGIWIPTGPLFEKHPSRRGVSNPLLIFDSSVLSTTCLTWTIKCRQTIGSAVTAASVWRTIMDQLQGASASLIPLLLIIHVF